MLHNHNPQLRARSSGAVGTRRARADGRAAAIIYIPSSASPHGNSVTFHEAQAEELEAGLHKYELTEEESSEKVFGQICTADYFLLIGYYYFVRWLIRTA